MSTQNGQMTRPAPPLRSEAMEDLISRPPAWPVRTGNLILSGFLLLLLVAGYFIRYPDTVTTRIVLTTEAQPVRLVAKTSGTLEHLFVQEKEWVEQGTPLAVIGSPATYGDVQVLIRWLAVVDSSLRLSTELDLPEPPEGLTLGAMQDGYTTLGRRIAEYRLTAGDSYTAAKRSNLIRQHAEYKRLSQTLAHQRDLIDRELALSQTKFERDRTLLQKQVLAPVEFEQSEAILLQKQYEREDAERALTSNRIRLTELEGALLELDREDQEARRTLRLALREAYETLIGQVTRWRQTYVLEAPVAGQIAFLSNLEVNQFVQGAEPVMAIVPTTERLLGKALLPQNGAGKVRLGQRVQVTLDSYPAAEFGQVEGLVSDISLVARQQTYRVQVALPQGLTTAYGETLEFRQEMEGAAVFITAEKNLLTRMLDGLLSLTSQT